MFIVDVETEERAALRNAVRGLLEMHSSEAAVRSVIESDSGYDTKLWHQMAEQIGLQGLTIDEESGGSGAGVTEQAIVFQELGRGLVPTPFLSTVGLAATLLQNVEDDVAAEYLERIANGSLVATVTLDTQGEYWDPAQAPSDAVEASGLWTITGERSFVLDGAAAELLLVPVRTERGLSVFAVEAGGEGVSREQLTTLDLTRPQARIVFENAPATLLGTDGGAETALQKTFHRGILAIVAEQTGAAEFLMGMALDYAKMRYQFGRQIGEFQAMKHKLAEMAFDLERMKSVLKHLVECAEHDTEDYEVVSHLAKAYCSEAFFRIAADTIQVHGGIGFTWEHPAHLYFRRAKSTEVIFGQPDYHRAQMLHLLETVHASDAIHS